MNELEYARIETIIEMHKELLKATHKIGMNHGENDPEIDAIIAASYTAAIKSLQKVYPGFIEFMILMLEKELDDGV